MSSSVDQIKAKIDIVSLISSYIKLDKAGTNFKGRCPFHNEKTPSFFVSPDRGSYYCFGCQAKGDIFTFVEEFEGLDFVGALKVLADKAGIKLDQYERGDRTEKDRLYGVLEQATFFFQKNLGNNTQAKEYLKKRGLTDDTISSFKIGYSVLDWRTLYEFLLSKGVTVNDMLAVGLIKRKEGTTDSFYDTFRGRVMFPISDSSGRVVGFSGRILVSDDKSPKYLNSPETALFNKSEILFGLDKAKNDIKIKDYSILVEGQMDLVMLHQIGLTNTVASSGTALTENHLVKLRRLSERIVMSFDADSAGFNASDRAAKIALSLGMDLKLVQMPEGKDPADLAKEDPEMLKECFRNSKSIVDFYIDTLLSKNLNPKDLINEIRKKVLPYISQMKEKTNQAHWIKVIMKKTFINEEALWDDLKSVATGKETQIQSRGSPPAFTGRTESIERKVFGFMIWQNGIKNRNKEDGGVVDMSEINKRIKDIVGEKFPELEKKFEKEKELLLFETESYYNNKANLSKELEELLMGLEEEYLKKDFGDAMVKLQKAEQTKNTSEILKFLEDCQRISQRINTIKMIKNAYEKN